jgi:hypothetical protein
MSDVNLNNNSTDVVVSAFRALLGCCPVAGSVLSELVTVSIPCQRIDRLVTFAKELEQKINDLQEDINTLKERMLKPEHTHLWEETLSQVVNASSQDEDEVKRRIECITLLLIKGVSEDENDRKRVKDYISIFRQISNEEIIILMNYGRREIGDYSLEHKFSDLLLHEYHISKRPRYLLGEEAQKYQKKMQENRLFQKKYNQNLLSLSLIQYSEKNDEFRYDEFCEEKDGIIRNIAYSITLTGRNLLTLINQPNLDNSSRMYKGNDMGYY